MLKLNIPTVELFDDSKNEFVISKGGELLLEHSLLSISKWESITKKPFWKEKLPPIDFILYIKCMCIVTPKDESIFEYLQSDVLNKIMQYMNDSMTATTFNDINEISSSGTFWTSELVYYYMIQYQIPFECQKWHINRLLTLMRISSEKAKTNNQMTDMEIYARNNKLNALRRAKYNSKG